MLKGPKMEKFTSVEKILDFAIAKEIEAETFYKRLSSWADNKETKDMFNKFATEELRHKMKLESIKQQGYTEFNDRKVQDLVIADYVVDVELQQDMSYADILIVAMKREKAAYRLYLDLAATAMSEELTNTFLMLAQEEATHKLRFEIEYDDAVLKED
jgi:rubrerythrin